jgi:hypothetical protein
MLLVRKQCWDPFHFDENPDHRIRASLTDLDPDPEGTKTYESYGSGCRSGSPTLSERKKKFGLTVNFI